MGGYGGTGNLPPFKYCKGLIYSDLQQIGGVETPSDGDSSAVASWLRGFLQQVHHQPVSQADRRIADCLTYIRVHELFAPLIRGQIRPRQFAAVDGLHLGLEAAAKLLRHRRNAEPVFHGVAPLLYETDSHHGADDGAADGSRVADPAAEATGDPGNDLVLYLVFLAHGQ